MRAAVLAVMLLAFMAVVSAAGAKEGLRAELLTPLSAAASPGTTVDVSWRLTTQDGSARTPFNAVSVFIRFLDARGGPPTEGLARGSSHPDGIYDATVRVPAGGLGGVQIGVRGTTDILAPLVSDPFSLYRPLHLPHVARGGRCPVSTIDRSIPFSSTYGVADGLGPGPVFPVFGGSTLQIAPPRNFGSARWGGQKVLWLVLPTYTGPVLIRGGRVDGVARIRFERGNIPALELRLDSSTVIAGNPKTPDGTRYRPSYTRLLSPGCYAYQIDGATFSTTVVFRAVRG